MDIGMLWYDNDPNTDLAVKVSKAAKYYTKKYGMKPNMCFVHPSMVLPALTEVGSIKIYGNKVMMPGHFWIGVHHNSDSEP